jgi:hypothetical protein
VPICAAFEIPDMKNVIGFWHIEDGGDLRQWSAPVIFIIGRTVVDFGLAQKQLRPIYWQHQNFNIIVTDNACVKTSLQPRPKKTFSSLFAIKVTRASSGPSASPSDNISNQLHIYSVLCPTIERTRVELSSIIILHLGMSEGYYHFEKTRHANHHWNRSFRAQPARPSWIYSLWHKLLTTDSNTSTYATIKISTFIPKMLPNIPKFHWQTFTPNLYRPRTPTNPIPTICNGTLHKHHHHTIYIIIEHKRQIWTGGDADKENGYKHQKTGPIHTIKVTQHLR